MTKRLEILAVALVVSILLPSSAVSAGGESQALSTKEVRALLLKDRDFRNDTELIALGEKVLPGLVDILDDSENQKESERALWVVARLKVEKQKVVPHIVPLLKRNSKWLRIYTLQALATLDASEATKDILPLLSDDDEAVRVNALRTLGEVGDRTTALLIREVLDKKRTKSNQTSPDKDYTFREGRKAIERIERRQKKRDEVEQAKAADK